MTPSIDLNADVGEGDESIDRALLDLVTSGSIACGGHAGDDFTMRSTVNLAAAKRVRIGAHPAYPDPANFGRISMALSPDDLIDEITRQVAALMRITKEEDAKVEYIKPHGALYNDAAKDPLVASSVIETARAFGMRVMTLAGSLMASEHADDVILEGFIDRAYDRAGSLVPRTEPNAIITDPDLAAHQALALATQVETLCVHSDTPGCVELMRVARGALAESGLTIASR